MASRLEDQLKQVPAKPGVYLFQCKLHSIVRGEVIVSDTPGDPNSDPGPQPPLNVDLKPPTLGSIALKKTSFKGTKGVGFSAQISDRGTLDGEYYRFNSKGKRVYNGYKTWDAFIGVNHLTLAARWSHDSAASNSPVHASVPPSVANADAITLSLLGEPENAFAQLQALPFVREASAEDGLIRLYVDRGETAMPALMRALDAANLEMATLTVARPSLDDVFLAKTGRSLRDDNSN